MPNLHRLACPESTTSADTVPVSVLKEANIFPRGFVQFIARSGMSTTGLLRETECPPLSFVQFIEQGGMPTEISVRHIRMLDVVISGASSRGIPVYRYL